MEGVIFKGQMRRYLSAGMFYSRNVTADSIAQMPETAKDLIQPPNPSWKYVNNGDVFGVFKKQTFSSTSRLIPPPNS